PKSGRRRVDRAWSGALARCESVRACHSARGTFWRRQVAYGSNGSGIRQIKAVLKTNGEEAQMIRALFSLRTAKFALICLTFVSANVEAQRTAFAADNGNIRRFEGRTLTIAGYSSTFNDVWAKSFGEYFEKRTGVKVKWIPSSIPANITRIRSAGG